MKPTTKVQKRVYSLSQALPKLTEEQKAWAEDKCFAHIGYRNKKGISCLDCGHLWAGQEAKKCTCPQCGVQLTIETTRKTTLYQERIFATIDTKEDFQVVRFFQMFANYRKGEPKKIIVHEVIQQFIAPDAKIHVVAKMKNFGWNSSFQGELENRHWGDQYDIQADKIFPKIKVLPIYKRNGFKTTFKDITPYKVFKLLATDAKFETLFKSNQVGLTKARAHYSHSQNVERYWDSIRICIRNNYVIKDPVLWLDHVALLDRLGKDLRNPKYICPINLKKDHSRAIARVNAIREKQSLEKKKAQIIEGQKAYEQEKKKFFGLVFSSGKITIKFLDHLQEFLEEGDIHKHCVFTNAYYEKKDSLIFSARVDDKPMETIEVSLSEMKIKQSRGLQNTATKYNPQIINLVNQNLDTIRKIYEQKQKVS